ncbi:helix-turn-helix domain-containing protein [Streptomyces sp. x-80]|uniref:helix-turn-helix domain-containing protein n=1 Tax=Streptomyces sp. x-80 TaxID=2789282 RepID=UPI00397F661A
MRSNVTSIEQYLEDVDQSPTALGLMLAKRLKELREEAGVSSSFAAKAIGVSASQVSRLESGKRRWNEEDLVAALRTYGVGSKEDHLARRLLRASAKPEWTASFRPDVLPEWFELFVGLESAARQIRLFETRAVPGLLQCDSYAQAIVEGDAMGAASLARRRLRLRKARQEQVFRRNGPLVWVVLEEGVLYRQFGDRHVMREQMLHLKHLAESDPQVKVQILPTNAGVSRPSGSFTYLRFNLEGISDKVYTESPAGATYYDDADAVERHKKTIDRLVSSALDGEEIPALLGKAVQSFENIS